MEKKRRALREVLESSEVRKSDREWSKVKRKISHRSAYNNLGETDARKTWELWSREEGAGVATTGSGGGDRKKNKRERSRESPPEDRHDRKRVLAEEKEEGEA
jgi:hypothetical protein